MRLCIYVLLVPPASAPCTRRIARGLSTRRAINLITGDTFWEPVIGSKPVNRLTGYRFTSLISALYVNCRNFRVLKEIGIQKNAGEINLLKHRHFVAT